MKIIQIAEALTMYILLLKSNSCLAHGATLPRILVTNKKAMTKKLKGIPPIRYNNPGGRPPVHDFSILEVNEGIETTISGVVCAKRYGRLSGRKFTQRKIDGKYYIYRVS